ncbi:ROK family protein [Candidatus Chloroploca asiatica]|uniref:ROK family protein n=1 Tax=Candidatus Chloroploca asiatica TaxID=1506545 RepID=A0A2H3LBE2_9CHLR|nr:ROK family protein [Candidatus Chloroploca asiatica]PDV99733.1 hypothetical protein A9Q02_00495 [Candidatus Chloroploca asiatica]
MDYVIAVDIGGTQLRAALVTLTGELVVSERTATLVHEGAEAVLGRVLKLIELVRAVVLPNDRLLGLGIGAPGPLDPVTGMIYSPPNMPGWDAFPLRDRVATATGLPVTLGNDANAAALGEWRFGRGQGLRHLVYLTVSTGIGGGVIVDGQLLLGRLGAAGEPGFLIVDHATGAIWEDLASGTALGREAAKQMPHYPDSALHTLATPTTVTAAEVSLAAQQGDRLARQLMEREARLLGMGFASMLHLFSPEILLVGGSVILHNPALLEAAREVAYANVRVPLYREVPILAASLGDHVGLLGAAALALQCIE